MRVVVLDLLIFTLGLLLVVLASVEDLLLEVVLVLGTAQRGSDLTAVNLVGHVV